LLLSFLQPSPDRQTQTKNSLSETRVRSLLAEDECGELVGAAVECSQQMLCKRVPERFGTKRYFPERYQLVQTVFRTVYSALLSPSDAGTPQRHGLIRTRSEGEPTSSRKVGSKTRCMRTSFWKSSSDHRGVVAPYLGEAVVQNHRRLCAVL
jgi:hypothetical protein